MAVRKRPSLTYTAQDVARFCEVDLKTVHHWADRGRVPHHRTEGRHLRFRRNDLLRFLRAHGYPLPDAIASVRPKIISTIAHDELGKKLSSRFTVRRLDSAILAIARIVSDEPDGLVFALDDPSFAGLPALVALKSDPATSWVALAVSTPPALVAAAKDAGAEVAVAHEDVARLASELGRTLAAN